jgi:acyl-CoA dehydrogenase
MGEGNYLARAYQGAPIAITVEGANILTRSLIIYGQGAIRCHPYVLAELAAANQTDDVIALKEFDHALFGHIGFAISNVVRSLWFSLTGARILKAPFRDETSRYYQLLTRFSSNLAMLSDISMLTLGGDLKRKERISARLGDVLSHLYLSSATLKRFNDEGRQQDDLPLVQWALEDSLYETQQAIDALISNFPNKIVALFLRAMIFPVGKWLKKPSDITDHKVAQILQTPGKARERLGQGQYLSRDPENVLGQLEQTLDDIIACEPIFKKVCQAIGEDLPFYALDEVAKKGLAVNVINAVEAELLCKAELGRKAAINVDDFDSDELRAQSASH